MTTQKNRVEKFLQASGFRLSSFVSNIFGASEMNIIHHLIEFGSIDRTAMNDCLETQTRNHIDEILMSVNGTLSLHQRSFLKMLVNHYEMLKAFFQGSAPSFKGFYICQSDKMSC